MKLTVEVFALLTVVMTTSITCGKPVKRVIIHVPMKVKHHHHTHTVYKPIHHALPVEVPDEHEEHHGWEDEYHISHGRMVGHYLSDLSSSFPHYRPDHDDDDDHDEEYENFEKLLKRRSKKKQKKFFSNKAIGWKGRQNFDKIASEYLLHLKNHPQQHFDEYEDRFAPYDDDDDDSRRKRK